MYEKIVNYFEEKMCIDNVYFREKHVLWIVGVTVTLIVEILINFIIMAFNIDLWCKTLIFFIIDIFITAISLLIIHVIPIMKIYKKKIKCKTYFDIIGLLMKQEPLSAYQEMQIDDFERFLKNDCKIKNVETIDILIETLDQEIQNKYSKKNIFENFNNSIFQILILILTVYFTNNNEQQLSKIIIITVLSFLTISISGSFILKLKNINFTPVNKKQNLIDLKKVLIDIKIKWSIKK